MSRRTELLEDVEYLAQTLEYSTFVEYNCQRATFFFKDRVAKSWETYQSRLNELTLEQVKQDFPFKAFVTFKKQDEASESLVDPLQISSENKDDLIGHINSLYGDLIVEMFEEL